ncbi:non-ribosomal peptide synthetase [Labedaea rhizosphaerae]|uniref:Amino acid adenylation domain-containing protein n=1 Tax=Labedaea rhizosphaerae TaxID=598644 RepID=A0A4R6S0V0_LABRH|nr:amino acid adenylation domain-containing protein [Labedaea rhizosphaerae]TDP92853.1 amino acid adenylation domain-containing protein [Labedaea rhizosphaerae]
MTAVDIPAADLRDGEPETVLAITESQRGLLVVDSMVSARQIYNQTMRFDLDPARCAVPLDAACVTRVLTALVAVQPALRQVFTLRPQVSARLLPVPGAAELPLRVHTVPGADYDGVLAQVGAEIGRAPFDLATGPVFRCAAVLAEDGRAASILLCAHHIVGDGLSMVPIMRDLATLLDGTLDPADTDALLALDASRTKGLVKELAAQHRAAGAEATAQKADAWAERLRMVPPLVLYPRPNRPQQTDFRGDRVSFTVDGALAERFTAACKRAGVSPFVLLTGVYSAVLARHGGVDKVLIGSPFAARRTIASFDLCGFFVNTLPITAEVDWARTVDEHLAAVRGEIDFCRASVDVPFTQLVSRVQPERTNDRNPLFSAMLAMQNTADNADGGPVAEVHEPANGTAKFDLWLGATPTRHGWLLELEYDRALIPARVAHDLLVSLRTALRRAITDGDLRLADLFDHASAAPSLRHDGRPATPAAPTITEWFEQTAERHPDRIAVSDPDGELTYRELAEQAGRLATGLAERGIGPGDVVGMRLDGLHDVVPTILAVLRRGAAYLPLETGLPVERLAGMVARAGCRLAVGEPIEGVPVPAVPLADLSGDARIAPSQARPDAGVYVLFTSGSTGRPKGVLMGQRSLLNLAAWQQGALDMSTDTRFLQFAPAGFDVSFQEIVPVLLGGGTVVSRRPADRRDMPAVLRRVADTAVTHVFLPAAALRSFVQCAARQRVHLPALRYLCVSGEQLLTDDEIRAFFVEHPQCELVNLYGPTEAQAVTTHRLHGDDPVWPTHVPIGTAMPGVATYVVDQTGHLAPYGVAGDLFIGGIAPAEGYINDPERTAAAFLPDHFGGNGVMYRTGDQVVRDEHDVLTYLGRGDTQVKIRGHRVELGELEAVANAVPGVRASVAVVRGDAQTRELVLFVVAEPDAELDTDGLRAVCARRLPPHMLPARIFDLDAVPLSATGKTDRKALTALADQLVAEQLTAPAPAAAAPADDLTAELCALWAKVLSVPVVDPDTPVMQYGGHSLVIVQVLGEVQQRYQVTVQVIDFLRAPTVATLAALIREATR